MKRFHPAVVLVPMAVFAAVAILSAQDLSRAELRDRVDLAMVATQLFAVAAQRGLLAKEAFEPCGKANVHGIAVARDETERPVLLASISSSVKVRLSG